MKAFSRKLNIGKKIRERIKDYPALKTTPKKLPDEWAECVDFYFGVPRKLDEEKNYCYSIAIFSPSYKKVLKMLDHALYVGNGDVEFRGHLFWLHAVKHATRRVAGKSLYMAELTYIFRVKKIPGENL